MMHARTQARTRLYTGALTLCLTACAADTTTYPSLDRRPAERTSASPAIGSPTQAAPVPAPAAADAGLPARLAALVEQARDADAHFASRRDAAERAVKAGSGASIGSEGWATASVALADLESARSDAMIALADIDQLYAGSRTRADVSANGGELAAIAAARDQVSAWIGEEDRVLAALRGRLGG